MIRHEGSQIVVKIPLRWMCKFLPHRFAMHHYSSGRRVQMCIRCKKFRDGGVASADIIVNGRKWVFSRPSISYQEVQRMAGIHHGSPSCTFRSPGQDGILEPGGEVQLVEGLVFNMYHTDNA